ncbi:hypothetical protein ACSBOB_01715 [Mesorhizobium sp. ASY16-5R]|uniref:hypothetical protein n=1 Tax=Mesorhizobium sp. ASY16-5R TaxID=3445772 RepID=UPI003FA0A950
MTSVMRICALAIEGMQGERDDLQQTHVQDVMHVLEHYADTGMDMYILAEANLKAEREAVQQ